MNSQEAGRHWSVFDEFKIFPSNPDALMADINTAISHLEVARASAILESPSYTGSKSRGSSRNAASPYDARMADEAYRAGRAALAAGMLDEALYSLNIALSRCPPDKASAVAKLQSLISLTSQKLQNSSTPLT